MKEGPLQRLVSACPILPFLSLGLWMADTHLMSSGTVWLSDTEMNGENISTLFVTLTLSFAFLLLFSVFSPPRVAKALATPRAVVAGGVVASLGCFIVIAIGPYYLMPVLPYEVIRALFYMSGVLGGLGLGVLCLHCGSLYSGLPPIRMTTYTALSFSLVAVSFFVVVGGPEWAPIEGGPSLVGIVVFVGSPLVAALLSVLPANLDNAVRPKAKDPLRSSGRTDLPVSFSKLMAVVFVFSLIMYTVRSATVQHAPVENTAGDTSVVMELLLFLTIGMAGFVAATGGARLNFGRIYSVVMVVSVALVSCLPMVSALPLDLIRVNAFLCYLFELFLWCVLSIIAYQRNVAALRVFGLGFGCYLAGSGIGWLFGSRVFGELLSAFGDTIPYMTMAFAVLACAFLIFSERELDLLFGSGGDVPSLEDLISREVEQAEASEASEPVETQIVHKGLFQEATQAIAASHGLSPRETDVLRCLARGYDANATAEKLHISWNTVRTHTRNLYTKLDVHSQQELIGLVDEARHSVEDEA
ncbi:LuxR family transcriptional regulator [Eggerthellaceae bacterium zg-887]|uniref:helix-turn-helix transcriptional regulator n=1 Tax=Xiamenia xianingshaonis TaxID=2682776 RepID=UPI00140AB94C|nr:LuxR C-terminal-related transcriptional regulator [Xiamenia xianingshaonis]NHM16242.1 LuxR family transcriptional regulator [Xiamenia xianingshaonis]